MYKEKDMATLSSKTDYIIKTLTKVKEEEFVTTTCLKI